MRIIVFTIILFCVSELTGCYYMSNPEICDPRYGGLVKAFVCDYEAVSNEREEILQRQISEVHNLKEENQHLQYLILIKEEEVIEIYQKTSEIDRNIRDIEHLLNTATNQRHEIMRKLETLREIASETNESIVQGTGLFRCLTIFIRDNIDKIIQSILSLVGGKIIQDSLEKEIDKSLEEETNKSKEKEINKSKRNINFVRKVAKKIMLVYKRTNFVFSVYDYSTSLVELLEEDSFNLECIN